jgi:hypothetical protein
MVFGVLDIMPASNTIDSQSPARNAALHFFPFFSDYITPA